MCKRSIRLFHPQNERILGRDGQFKSIGLPRQGLFTRLRQAGQPCSRGNHQAGLHRRSPIQQDPQGAIGQFQLAQAQIWAGIEQCKGLLRKRQQGQ